MHTVPCGSRPETKAALEGQKLAATTAMMSVADSVTIANVIEASKHLDPLVLQTWLAQRGQGFQLDAKKLAQLADAKVPSNAIDVMVALSYPQVFAVNLAQANGQIVQTSGQQQVAAEEGRRDGPMVFMSWDPFYSSRYGYGYGNPYYSGYRYGFGYGYSGNWYRNTPIVIVRPSQSVEARSSDHGRMVRGSGYTRPSGGGSSGSPRGSTSDGGSSGGSSSGSSGGSSSGGEGRTAKPRSP
jgi:hypothetical protein